VIAAVNALAFGGFEIALARDVIVVASETACPAYPGLSSGR
jgi:enoyl-CoA hydratase/carnithine racemase